MIEFLAGATTGTAATCAAWMAAPILRETVQVWRSFQWLEGGVTLWWAFKWANKNAQARRAGRLDEACQPETLRIQMRAARLRVQAETAAEVFEVARAADDRDLDRQRRLACEYGARRRRWLPERSADG